MKIVHLLWGLPTGGAESMLVDLVNRQIKSEKVHILALNDNTNQDLLNKISSQVYVHQCKRPLKSKNPFFILKLNALILKINPDIIHCHSEGLAKYVFFPYKMVRTIHNTMCDGKDYHRFKKLFCISKGVKKYTESQGFFNTELIYNGINTAALKQKQDFGKKDIVKFVSIGRFQHVKGQWLLIQASEILKKKYLVENFHIDFIGDGETMQECQLLVKKSCLEKEISFLGLKNREFFYPKLMDYDCFVLPSVSEGFGLVVAEAMCAKLPVIISNLDGPMEIIDNGKYGDYFESGNAESLASKMHSFITKDVDENRISEGFRFVKEFFDVEETARRYIEEYKKII